MNVSIAPEFLNSSIENNVQNETSQTTFNNLTVFQIGILIIILLVLAGNFLILWAIYKFNSLHKVTYYLLGNLAVADIIVAIGFACVFFSHVFGLRNYPFIIGTGLVFISHGISLSGTVLVSVHSFLAVRFPVRFRDGFDLKIAGILGLVTWLFWISLSLTGLLTSNFQLDQTVDNNLVSFTKPYAITKAVLTLLHLVVLVYLQVSTVIRIRKKKTAAEAQGPPGNPITNAILNRLKNTSKIVWIVSAIAVLCIIAWLPTSILSLLLRLCPSCGVTGKHFRLSGFGLVPNMIGNIVIYFVKSKEFKKVFKTLCKCRSNQVHPE